MELEKAIEQIMNNGPVRFAEINLPEIAALGFWRNPLWYLVNKQGVDKWGAYDMSGKMSILEVYDDPLISREDYIRLTDGHSEQHKSKIASRNTIGLYATIGLKPRKNIIWRIKNWMGTYELDKGNILYELSERTNHNQEMEIWSSDEIVPIYRTDPNYRRIKEELEKHH